MCATEKISPTSETAGMKSTWSITSPWRLCGYKVFTERMRHSSPNGPGRREIPPIREPFSTSWTPRRRRTHGREGDSPPGEDSFPRGVGKERSGLRVLQDAGGRKRGIPERHQESSPDLSILTMGYGETGQGFPQETFNSSWDGSVASHCFLFYCARQGHKHLSRGTAGIEIGSGLSSP